MEVTVAQEARAGGRGPGLLLPDYCPVFSASPCLCPRPGAGHPQPAEGVPALAWQGSWPGLIQENI